MKLKCRPQDFIVREQLDWRRVPRGPYGIYAMRKQKHSTLDALRLVARETRVPLAEIGYAGLKDRQARATQFVSLPGPDRSFQAEDVSLRYLGRSDEPIRREQLRGNSFELIARALTGTEMRSLLESATEVREHGLPNYFDNQRFECMLPGGKFVGEALLAGEWEQALKWFLVGQPGRGGGEHETAGYLRRHWGEWERCAKRFSRRRIAPLLRHLTAHPKDHAGAFGFVNPDLFRLHMYAFQSYLWNQALAVLLSKVVPGEELTRLHYVAGDHICHRRLMGQARQTLEQLTLPLPGPTLPKQPPLVAETWREVFKAARLPAKGLTIDWPAPRGDAERHPTWQYREEPRPMIITPEGLHISPSKPDPLHKGLQMMRVQFSLPPGAYATLLLKRLARNADLFKRERKEKPEPPPATPSGRKTRERPEKKERPGPPRKPSK